MFCLIFPFLSSGELPYCSLNAVSEIVIVINLTLIYFSSCITVLSYEDYSQVKACCTFNGPGFEHIEYIIMDNFNEKLMKEYNSTRGNWTGFTAFAIEMAKSWNADPYDALQRAFEKKLFCTDNKNFVQSVGMNMFYSNYFHFVQLRRASYRVLVLSMITH